MLGTVNIRSKTWLLISNGAFNYREMYVYNWTSPVAQQFRSHRTPRFDPLVGKIPWRRAWQPASVFLPGESHGQRSLVGYSPWCHKSQTRLKWLSTKERTISGTQGMVFGNQDVHSGIIKAQLRSFVFHQFSSLPTHNLWHQYHIHLVSCSHSIFSAHCGGTLDSMDEGILHLRIQFTYWIMTLTCDFILYFLTFWCHIVTYKLKKN